MKEGHIWIDGVWESTKETMDLIAPYTGQVIGQVAIATKEDVNRAIEGAEITFQTFKKWTAYERAELLYKVVDILRVRKEELAQILAEEAGKPLKAARAEYDRTIATYQFAAEEAKQLRGETIPFDAAPGAGGRIGWTKREPLGVVIAISPFNFPANLIAHKLGPAFAVGNTVVLKPSSATPKSALVLAEIFREAGLPDGALQIVTGSGKELSENLITHPAVKKITFTGSVPVGISIKEQIGLRKITLELGSNSALIVEPGVPLDKIMKRCVDGAFGFAGQVCISLQRVYVHQSIYSEFIHLFAEETKKLVIGDPLDENTDVSAMINPGEVIRIREWVEEAVSQGAKIVVGGEFGERTLTPTVLTNVNQGMTIVCKEVFAPVVCIMPYNNLEEAIALVNHSEFGLNAGIYTPNIIDAMYAADEIQAGAIIINDIPTFRVDNMPYGGIKMSGYGREGVKYAIEEMTELKLITMKTSFE